MKKVVPSPDMPGEERKESKLQEFSGNDFCGEIDRSDEMKPAPTTICIPLAIWHIISCTFLTFGDKQKNARSQKIQEQLNIALVSSLFLTISIPAMLSITDLADHNWNDLERQIFGLSLCVATANFAIAVIFAVFFSLAIQECVDDAELRRFITTMGRQLRLSSVAFIAGVLTIGGFSWPYWCYVSFDFHWFMGIFFGCIVINTFVFVFYGLVVMVKALYSSKGGRTGKIVINREQLLRAIKAYLKKLSSVDLATHHDAREFILSQAKCSGLSEMTERRFRRAWREELRRQLAKEYERRSRGSDSDQPSASDSD